MPFFSQKKNTYDQVPPNSRASSLSSMLEDDVIEVVLADNKIVNCSRNVLITSSKLLERKILKLKTGCKKITAPVVGSSDFKLLMQCINSQNLPVNCSNFFNVFRAASVLEMNSILHKCYEFLESMDEFNASFYLYVLTRRLGVGWFRPYTVLTSHFEETACSPEFLQLDVNSLIPLVSTNALGTRSEVVVFSSVLRWINHDPASRLKYLNQLLRCIRFNTMSIPEIEECNKIAKRYKMTFILELPEVMSRFLDGSDLFHQGKRQFLIRSLSPSARNLNESQSSLQTQHDQIPERNKITDHDQNHDYTNGQSNGSKKILAKESGVLRSILRENQKQKRMYKNVSYGKEIKKKISKDIAIQYSPICPALQKQLQKNKKREYQTGKKITESSSEESIKISQLCPELRNRLDQNLKDEANEDWKEGFQNNELSSDNENTRSPEKKTEKFTKEPPKLSQENPIAERIDKSTTPERPIKPDAILGIENDSEKLREGERDSLKNTKDKGSGKIRSKNTFRKLFNLKKAK